MIFLFPVIGSVAQGVTFDAELSESRNDEYEWTQHAVESEADIARYGRVKPKRYECTGRITQTPTGQPKDPDRPGRIYDQLIAMADQRQPVILVTGTWAETVVITSVRGERRVEHGASIEISLAFQTVERPTPRRARVPIAFKPIVRRMAPPARGGGSAALKPIPRSDASRTGRIVDGKWVN